MREVEDKPRVPLKTILQNFLNHVDSMESEKRERDNPFEKEFQSLKAFSDSLKQQPEFCCKEGEKEVNRKKNRYKDILPFDYTRVSLSDYPGVPGSDYINANYIKGASGSNAYIACQGPLPNTVNEFWRMVVECEVQVIVMACNEQEAGKYKCENYWNDAENEEKQFGKFFVKLIKSREICPDFLVRTMRLRWTADGGKSNGEEERTVCQFHYSAWPDHGVPTQVKPLLEMVRLIRDCQASETLPVLVHCSAGCGRTGTICAIDFIWGLLRTGKLTSEFSLYELVRDMRRQRIAMVQTVEQYILVHRAVRELFQEQLRVIDSHPYENVDGDGRPLCHNDNDEIAPDYETIFVQQNDENASTTTTTTPVTKNAIEIDNILSLRMQQNKIASDNAAAATTKRMPGNESQKSSDEDSVERLPSNRSSDSLSLLFDPPVTSSSNGDLAGTQKIKKGDLRLTQMENGSWRLEDNEKTSAETTPSASSTATPTATKMKKKKSEDLDSHQQQLLRRPSIKKIRAFFTKNDADESKEVLAAISKLPKFDPTGNLKSESTSMPNSLDRRLNHQKSVDSAKILSSTENKPSLPVKRSKSMKVISKPVSFLFSPGSGLAGSEPDTPAVGTTTNKQFVKCHSVVESPISRSETYPSNATMSTTRFDFENIPAPGKEPNHVTGEPAAPRPPPPKPVRSNSEYISSSESFRNRISNYVSSRPNSSNSLNEDAKKMLKDCQDYLVASFETAEKEGEKLLKNVAQMAKNRSAESSPMTTLHKTSSAKQLFSASSQSSPANSYNKYTNVATKGPVANFQKSVSSPTGTIQKSFCSPASKPVIVGEDGQGDPCQKHNYENVSLTDGLAALAAQRKISAASVTSSTRERRNSFREAVQGEGSGQRKQSYESIWFVGDGEEVVYANVSSVRSGGHVKEASNSRSESSNSQLDDSMQTERERMGMDESGEMDYESVVVSADGRMVSAVDVAKKTSRDNQLTSVALVNENWAQQEEVRKSSLRKQFSNSSIHSSGSAGCAAKGPPPPYKQPPPPPPTATPVHQSRPHNDNTATYANVQMRHSETSTSKDDSVLSRPVHRRPVKTRSASQIVQNRLSCGEYLFSSADGSGHSSSIHGLSVKSGFGDVNPLNKSAQTSLPGIDLDAVAAMMQGGSSRASTNSPVSSNGGGSSSNNSNAVPPRAITRTLAGVISGAAANLRSRFAILQQPVTSSSTSENNSSLPSTLPSMVNVTMPTPVVAGPSTYHGEQLPSMLPVTVPGASEPYIVNQSFPFSFPNRLENRPMGPRDPPAHFQRKQEYL